MKAVVAAFNQEKALVGAFSVIVQPVVEPMEHYTALPYPMLLPLTVVTTRLPGWGWVSCCPGAAQPSPTTVITKLVFSAFSRGTPALLTRPNEKNPG